jgi:hypothetical protein
MEVRSVRLDEIRLIKEDIPNSWTRYIGRSDSFLASDSDPYWQIMRIVKEGTIWTTTYANKGSFTAKWSLRDTYFPAITVSYAAFGQDMGANFTSDNIVMGTDSQLAIQLIWSGNDSNSGSIQIEASVDGACWCEVPNGDFTIPLVAGCQPFDMSGTGFPFYRVKYLKGSNTTGSLDIAYSTSGSGKLWGVK